MAEDLLGSSTILKTKSGDSTVADVFKDAKLIGLYFSMHNCPPCR